MKESAIQKTMMDWLAAKRVLSFRMNVGAISAEHNGNKRFMRFGVKGMADILAFMPGPVWIEVKAEKGKQSDLQRSFQAMVEAHGHRYVVARSVEDVERMEAR